VRSKGNPTTLLGVASTKWSREAALCSESEIFGCSLVAGVRFTEELGPDGGSAMVDADPCVCVKPTMRFCKAGLEDDGVTAPERAETCRCNCWRC